MAVYFASTGKWLKARCGSSARKAGSGGCGLALNAAGANGRPIAIARQARSSTWARPRPQRQSVTYYVGATPGALVPLADLLSTNKVASDLHQVRSNKVRVNTGVYSAGSVIA